MQQMQRKNYARLSGVVVDQCAKHGVYFDAGELAQVLGFVATGGLTVVRQRKIREQEYEDRQNSYLKSFGQSQSAIYLDSMGPMRQFNPGIAVDVFGLMVRAFYWIVGVFFR